MFTDNSGRLHPVWAFVLSAMLSAVAFQLCAWLAEAVSGDHVLISELLFRSSLVLVLLGLYSWLLATADHVGEHRLAAMGLPRRAGAFRQWVTGCVLGFALVLFAIVPILVVDRNIHADIHLSSRALLRLVIVLIVLGAGSLAEELMFRGYPFQRLEQGIGAVGAILVFSLLFSGLHLLNPGATPWSWVNTTLIGIVLAIAYLRTRALWLPWGIHYAWNTTLGVLFGLPVSGMRIFNVVIRTTIQGPKWLTGGSYGIEAGATGAAAVMIGLAVVAKWPFRPLREPQFSLPAETIRPQHSPGIQS